MQQSLALLLGVLDYRAQKNGLSEAVSCLLASIDKKVSCNTVDVLQMVEQFSSRVSIWLI